MMIYLILASFWKYMELQSYLADWNIFEKI